MLEMFQNFVVVDLLRLKPTDLDIWWISITCYKQSHTRKLSSACLRCFSPFGHCLSLALDTNKNAHLPCIAEYHISWSRSAKAWRNMQHQAHITQAPNKLHNHIALMATPKNLCANNSTRTGWMTTGASAQNLKQKSSNKQDTFGTCNICNALHVYYYLGGGSAKLMWSIGAIWGIALIFIILRMQIDVVTIACDHDSRIDMAYFLIPYKFSCMCSSKRKMSAICNVR